MTTYLKIDPRMLQMVDDGKFTVLEIDRDFLDGCGVEGAKDFTDEDMRRFAQSLWDALAENQLHQIIKIVGENFESYDQRRERLINEDRTGFGIL